MVRITNRFMISSREFVRSRFGAKGWNDFMAALTPQTRRVYEGKLKPKGDIEFDRVADVLKTVETLFGPQQSDVLFRMGRFNSEDDLSATQKLVMRLISVEWVLKAAALLWGQRVINGGTMTIERVHKGKVIAKVSGFETPIDQWWTYLTGWFTTAIEFSGGKQVNVAWNAGGKSQSDPAIFNASWI